MHKFRYLIFAALLACLIGMQSASAQTAANVSIVSGSGQIYCSCPTISGFANGGYAPLVVKVTDAFGRPVAGATVNWALTNTTGFTGYVQNATTTTGSDGTSSNNFVPQGGAQLPSTQPVSYQVTASSGSGAAIFSLTQAFDASGAAGSIGEDLSNMPTTSQGNTLSGTAGQQGYTLNGTSGLSFRVGVLTGLLGTPVPGVSLRIENFQDSPTASCVTGPGADPGSVLTDSTGYATCTPVFSGSGTGSFLLVIGGVVDPSNPGPRPSNLLYYYLSAPPTQFMTVTAAVPTSISIVSGNGQSISAGSQLSQPLVATVNAQNGGTLSGQAVTWSISPSTAGTLSALTGTSDQNGQVANNLTLNGNAAGNISVTVAVTSNPSVKATFTVTAIPVITVGGFTKISGDNQTAVAGAQFAQPLVVQVNTNTGAPASGIPVSFSASGGAILSATTVTTGANGQASTNVTAPNASGSITVTAAASGLTQTFTLTVAPPGPSFTANSFVNAADLKVNSLSPCSLATVVASGIAPGIQGTVLASSLGIGPASTTLSGESLIFGGAQVPILSVASVNGTQSLTFQVPCNATTGNNSVVVNVNGGGSANTSVNLQPVSPGAFQTATTLTLSNGATYPMGVFIRPDGSFVSASNAARKGETITALVTGLGPASPSVNTGNLPLPTAISMAVNTPVVGVANAGVPVVSAQLSPDLVGVYLVSFQLPTSAPSGNQVFSVGVSAGGQTYYSAGAAIPIL